MQLLRHPPGRIVSLPECAGTAVFALFPVLLATNEVWPRFPQLAFLTTRVWAECRRVSEASRAGGGLRQAWRSRTRKFSDVC